MRPITCYGGLIRGNAALEQGIARLVHLPEQGEMPYAFAFKSNFTADEAML